jgi:probable HAF family extracellular repeat protein
MQHLLKSYVLTLGFILGAPPLALAYTFTIIDVPGAFSTRPIGINDAGQIVGTFRDATGQHGFLLSGGTFTTIDAPGAANDTEASGINAAGQIVGVLYDGTRGRGFLLTGGNFTIIDVPGAFGTRPIGINDAGQIVGTFNDARGQHGFLLSGGTFTTIDAPGAANDTEASGINNTGQILGVLYDGRRGRGFVATPYDGLGIDGPSGVSVFTAELTGEQEVPGVVTSARGVGTFTLTSAGLAFKVTVDGLSGPMTGAHVHLGAPGTKGAIVRTITGSFVGNTASGMWTGADSEPLTQALINALFAEGLYVNVHTALNPDGEIRGQIGPATLLAAVLPSSRSAQVGTPATAFATIINAGAVLATDCSFSPLTGMPAHFAYQATDPITNQPVGGPDTPVDIAAGAAQSFILALTPTAPIAPTDVQFIFDCANTYPAPTYPGLNTLLFSASATPIPDIVALAATISGDGIVNIPGTTGTGVFAVATVNVGASGSITASADTGGVPLPVDISISETHPATGQCISAIGPSVPTVINATGTPTFAIFVTGRGHVAFDPAAHRLFVRFTDAGAVTRGSTSVAVRTQ